MKITIELTWFISTKNSSTTIPTNKNMESAKIIMIREAKNIIDLVFRYNRTFDYQVSISIRIIFDDSMK